MRRVMLCLGAFLTNVCPLGCAVPSAEPAVPLCSNDASDVVDPIHGTTFTYVVSVLQVDKRLDGSGNEVVDASATNSHTGFNLDGRYSDSSDMEGCLIPDFYSKYDSNQHLPAGCARSDTVCKGGIDNNFLALSDALAIGVGDWNQVFKNNIAARDMVIIVRITGVNDLVNDPDVMVKLYNGYAAFAPPCGNPRMDQPYTIAQSSLENGSTDIEQSLVQMPGSISNGRLTVASGGHFDVSMRLAGRRLLAPWQDPHIAVDLCVDGTVGGRGNFGAWMRGMDLRTLLIHGAPQYESLFDLLLPQFLDVIDPNVRETSMKQCILPDSARPDQWGGLSAGFGLTLLRAQLASAVPTESLPRGMCGTVDAPLRDAGND